MIDITQSVQLVLLGPVVLKILTSYLDAYLPMYFIQFGSNKVETESESTTLLSEIAVKDSETSFYEHCRFILPLDQKTIDPALRCVKVAE